MLQLISHGTVLDSKRRLSRKKSVNKYFSDHGKQFEEQQLLISEISGATWQSVIGKLLRARKKKECKRLHNNITFFNEPFSASLKLLSTLMNVPGKLVARIRTRISGVQRDPVNQQSPLAHVGQQYFLAGI